LDAPTFFVGLRGDGSVAHIVTERSSGNADIDLRAMQILKSLRFLPAENLPLTWGFVDFHLGTHPAPDQP
jgi:outer membrane biosynthesis protein TonB